MVSDEKYEYKFSFTENKASPVSEFQFDFKWTTLPLSSQSLIPLVKVSRFLAQFSVYMFFKKIPIFIKNRPHSRRKGKKWGLREEKYRSNEKKCGSFKWGETRRKAIYRKKYEKCLFSGGFKKKKKKKIAEFLLSLTQIQNLLIRNNVYGTVRINTWK